jgi:class 3 adenylate cyclase
MDENLLRNKLSLLLAQHFRRHLEEELEKSIDLVNLITTEGIPFRDVTQSLLEKLEIEFPELKNLPSPTYNLFYRWNAEGIKVNSLIKPYPKTTFKLFNQRFFVRLKDIKYNSKEVRRELKETLENLLPKQSFYGHKINFNFLFTGETMLKEAIRELIFSQEEIPKEESYRIFNEQSMAITTINYTYFDKILQDSLDRTDTILKRTLPDSIAEELKKNQKVKPTLIEEASVCFTDFSGFTKLASSLNPEELLEELDFCFSKFDSIIEKYHLEKIKTIGDAYLFTGGIFSEKDSQVYNTIEAAKEILQFIKERKIEKNKLGLDYWGIRIGIHIGPIIAGVIGVKRFAFDIWGDTVNIASRMESNSETNKINVSQEIYTAMNDKFSFTERDYLEVKGKGKMKMFFLENESNSID